MQPPAIRNMWCDAGCCGGGERGEFPRKAIGWQPAPHQIQVLEQIARRGISLAAVVVLGLKGGVIGAVLVHLFIAPGCCCLPPTGAAACEPGMELGYVGNPAAEADVAVGTDRNQSRAGRA